MRHEEKAQYHRIQATKLRVYRPFSPASSLTVHTWRLCHVTRCKCHEVSPGTLRDICMSSGTLVKISLQNRPVSHGPTRFAGWAGLSEESFGGQSLRAGPGPFIHGLKSGLRTRTNIITSADYASRSYWTLIKWVWRIRYDLHLKEEYQLSRRILSLLSRVTSHFMPAVMFFEAPRHRLWNISCEALYSCYTLIASNWNASHNRHFACIRI